MILIPYKKGMIMSQTYPHVNMLGINDLSGAVLYPSEPVLSTHLPLMLLFTQKGPTTKELVGENAIALYGQDSFDPRKPYFKHATKYALDLLGKGNSLVVKRLIDPEANVLATTTIYVDYIKDTVKTYKRNADGSIATDDNGDPIEDQDITGYRIKLIAETNPMSPDDDLGNKQSKTGYMTDSNGNQSTMVPIVEIPAAYPGDYYNRLGFAFELKNDDDILPNFIEKGLTLPYEVYLFLKDDFGTPVNYKSLSNSIFADFAFRKDFKDPITNASMTLPDAIDKWFNETDPKTPLRPREVGKPYVYYDNIDRLLNEMLETEKPYINTSITLADGSTGFTGPWFDFVDGVDIDKQAYLLSIFTGYSTKGVKYFSIKIDDSYVSLPENQEEVMFSKHTPTFLGGGTDGDLSDSKFEELVLQEISKYADPNSEVINMARNPENVFYDTGFSFDTKLKLVPFITIRKDTALVLTTWEASLTRPLTPDEEYSRGVALYNALKLAPESTFFGTGVTRGAIVAGCGDDPVDNAYGKYSILIDQVRKFADMMAGQEWDTDKYFFRGGLNIIDTLINISPSDLSETMQAKFYDAGMIYPIPRDMKRYEVPVLQTVYDDDTSILNSLPVALAATIIEKVIYEAWLEYVGDMKLGKEAFVDAVADFISKRLNKKFGDIIKVVPRVTIVGEDEALGYKWTVAVEMYSNVMKLEQTGYIEAYRMADYTG